MGGTRWFDDPNVRTWRHESDLKNKVYQYKSKIYEYFSVLMGTQIVKTTTNIKRLYGYKVDSSKANIDFVKDIENNVTFRRSPFNIIKIE